MDRRVLLAVVLCLLTVIGWTFLQAAIRRNAPPPPPAESPAVAPGEAGMNGAGNPVAPPGVQPPTVPGPNPPAVNPGVPAPPPAPPPPPPVQKQDPEKSFDIDMPAASEWLHVGFTNRGGAIRYVTLRGSYEFPNKKHNLDLILPGNEDRLSGMLAIDAADVDRMRTLTWTRDEQAESKTPELDVVFTFDTVHGYRVTKRFVLPTTANRFDCDVEISAAPLAGKPGGEEISLRLLGVAGVAREPQDFTTGLPTAESLVYYVLGAMDEPEHTTWQIDPVKIEEPRYSSRGFRLVGVQTQYFAAVLWADGDPKSRLPRVKGLSGGGAAKDGASAIGDALVKFFEVERARFLAGDSRLAERVDVAKKRWLEASAEFDLKVQAAAGGGETAVFHIYAGPTSRQAFGDDRYSAALEPLITYPYAPDFVARFLLTIFDFWKWLLGSAGIAVILMTLVVRGAMMPLSVKNQLSMRRHGRKIARLKPKLEVLKKKWAHDKRRYQEEQMKLYREHGIGFPMGCLMIFIQIPIFMALFSCLRIDFGLHHQSFLWITDLSGPDRLIDFGRNVIGPFPFPAGGINGLNLLPLLSVVLSIYQQKMMPKPTDPQQEQQMKMMKWMPIFFAVLLYNYTAGLSLYMIFSSTVAILESKWVKHHDALEQLEA